jgi:hypothetical protein
MIKKTNKVERKFPPAIGMIVAGSYKGDLRLMA